MTHEELIHREQTLHKLVAASGFMFALCILPVAQYYLVAKQLPENNGQSEQGIVAGASTDETITRANVPNNEDCLTKKDKDLSDLNIFYEGKKTALYREYSKAVEPYVLAKGVLTGTPESIMSEKEALDKLISEEYNLYNEKLIQVDTAVVGSKKEITARTCQ